jgi:MGT family glycosyltransferase
MFCLCRELAARGHRMVFAMIPDAELPVREAGFEFVPFGAAAFPSGRLPEVHAELGRRAGLAALRYTLDFMGEAAVVAMREAPAAFARVQPDLLLVDQAAPGGNAVAEQLQLPWVSLAHALLFNMEPGVPPLAFGWTYSNSGWGRLRNACGRWMLDRLIARLARQLAAERRRLGLPPVPDINASFSPYAQISQQVAEFEFPRKELPAHFHFAGPFHDVKVRAAAPFPFDRLDGRPLVYASLGTLQNRLHGYFHAIAAACASLPFQLVLSLGGSAEPESLGPLPGDPLVVRFAPQLELIPRAALVITHAGLNTTLESLAHGVPLVAIPITNDQPAVAARIAWTGTGRVVPPRQLNPRRLQHAIQQVLHDPGCRFHARRLQAAIARSGRVRYAADVIERVLQTGKPVLNN